MKFTWTSRMITLISTFSSLHAFADTSYDANTVVTPKQLEGIVASLLQAAPSGTKTEDIKFQGYFTISDSRHLTAVDLSSISFKVTTKILFIPITSDVTLQLGAIFPDLDCNKPQITRNNVYASNSLFEGPIKEHMDKNIISIIRDNIVAQTGLRPYCKVKPVSQQGMNGSDDNIMSDYASASEEEPWAS